jgi:hypothetical protein
MKHLPTMNPEVAASAHIHHPGRYLDVHRPQRRRSHTQLPKLILQDDAHKRDVTLMPSSPAPAN